MSSHHHQLLKPFAKCSMAVYKPRPKNHACLYQGCGKAYLRPALLRQHERSHTNERPFVCPEEGCGKAFLRKSHLQVHEQSHKEEKDKCLKCEVCGKGVNAPHILKRHMLTHTKQFKCPYDDCSEAFYHYKTMVYHVDHVHKKVTICEFCNRHFQNRHLLADHRQKEHGVNEVFLCPAAGCFATFLNYRSRQDHYRQNHRLVRCHLCDYTCDSKVALKIHVLQHKNVNGDLHKNDNKNDNENGHGKDSDEDVNETSNGKSSLQSLQRYLPERVSIVEDAEHNEEKHQDEKSRSKKDPAPVEGNLVQEIPQDESISRMLLGIYVCPHEKCSRTFERHVPFLKHVQWHEKRDEARLQDNENSDLDLSAAEEELED